MLKTNIGEIVKDIPIASRVVLLASEHFKHRSFSEKAKPHAVWLQKNGFGTIEENHIKLTIKGQHAAWWLVDYDKDAAKFYKSL